MTFAPTPNSPASDLSTLLASGQPVALFEDNLGDGGATLFHDLAAYICAWQPEEVPGALAHIEAAGRHGQWVVLGASYELGYALEPALLARQPASAQPLLEAWVWHAHTPLSGAETAALLTQAHAALPESQQIAGLTPLIPERDLTTHAHAVSAVQSLIEAGDCYQVNLTFPMRCHSYGDPLALYIRLRAHQPVQYGGFVRHARGTILSRSPELFIARQGARLTARPMKGTAPRGERERLAGSEKDRAENLMIVDLLRNDLGKLAPAGGVKVTALFALEDYATVHQMTSTIVAEPVDAPLGEILHALFPCGSITGAPKIRAMEIIREHESQARGLYCGALGWIAPSGDFKLNVPIRTLELDRDGAVRLHVGSGIVADSQPAAEYAECLAKARFASELAPPFQLIETLRYEPGQGIPLQDRHLARLARSAQALGFVFNHDEVCARLAAFVAREDDHPVRIRLTLAATGEITLTSATLDALPERVSVVYSPHPLPDGDMLCGHKTTARARYDAELARVVALGHFDAVFFNAQDELCEGARSNVFVQFGGALYTPPLSSGVLPGVMREALLAQGAARQRVIHRSELEQAEAFYVSNALRGLIRVSLD